MELRVHEGHASISSEVPLRVCYTRRSSFLLTHKMDDIYSAWLQEVFTCLINTTILLVVLLCLSRSQRLAFYVMYSDFLQVPEILHNLAWKHYNSLGLVVRRPRSITSS
jgi:hypothetical protein